MEEENFNNIISNIYLFVNENYTEINNLINFEKNLQSNSLILEKFKYNENITNRDAHIKYMTLTIFTYLFLSRNS
jgi:hypothetical protein